MSDIRYTVEKRVVRAEDGLVLPEGARVLDATTDDLGEHSYFTVLHSEKVDDEPAASSDDGR